MLCLNIFHVDGRINEECLGWLCCCHYMYVPLIFPLCFLSQRCFCWWNSLWLAWKLAQAAQQPWSGRRLWSCTGAWKSRAELPSSSTQFLHVSSWCSATSGCSWHAADTPPLEGLLILRCVIYDPLEGSQIWKMKAAKMGVQDLIFAFVNMLHMPSYIHRGAVGGVYYNVPDE